MDQVFNIPWKACYGDEKLALSFPVDWEIKLCTMDDAPELTEREIEEVFEAPIGTPKIRELAKGKKNGKQ